MNFKFLLFTAAFLILVFGMFAQTSSPPSEGDGSEENPYQISTLDNLYWLSQDTSVWSRTFIQTEDIDASETSGWNDGGFSPIGNDSISFTGYYNGGGHAIKGLNITRFLDEYYHSVDRSDIGLFGYISGAYIDSLRVLNVNINQSIRIGALVGHSDGGSIISNCSCSGNVITPWDGLHAGGLVGKADNSTIINCHSTCIVGGSAYVGGLVGISEGSTIKNCYSSGNVSVYAMYAGGLLGKISNSTIINCYSTGDVLGDLYDSDYGDYIGGFIGSADNTTIMNCYSVGNVVPGISGTSPGGFVGENTNSTYTNCFYDINTSCQSSGIGVDDNSQTVIGYTTSQMKQVASLSVWDIVNGEDGKHYWRIREGKTYPALDSVGNNAPFAFADTLEIRQLSCDLDTSLLNNDYDYETLQTKLTYKIDTLPKNGTISSGVFSFNSSATTGDKDSLYYRVGEIIAVGDTLWGNKAKAVFTLGATQSLEGSGTEEDPYLITSLDDLQFLSESSSLWNEGYYFKQTEDIDASETKTWNDGAGFSPIGNETTKFNGHYNGSGHNVSDVYIHAQTDNIGLFGYISSAEIDSLGIVDVDCEGNETVGALVGFCSESSTVSSCYSTGSVSVTTETAGGLIGCSLSSNISNCYSTASVSGDSEVGGFVGYAEDINIMNCYSYGSLSGTTKVGGFGGEVHNAVFTGCYYNTETSGASQGESSGTVIGLTTLEMQTIATFEEWDFEGLASDGTDDIWAIATWINNGCPILMWQIRQTMEPVFGDVSVTVEDGGTAVSLACSFTSLGVPNPAVYGFCYSTTNTTVATPDVLNADTTCLGAINGYEAAGDFTTELTGLNGDATYYICAYAINGEDTVYSNVVNTYQPKGSGSESDPFLIETLRDLQWLSEDSAVWDLDYYFKQTADIDASETSSWDNGEGFSPIGNTSIQFSGDYNGAGHAVEGLYIYRIGDYFAEDFPEACYIGMFGIVSGGKIDSLNVLDSDISGYRYVAALIGRCNETTTISNCSSSGVVNSLVCMYLPDYSHYAGGLAAYASNATISNSYSTCNVSGDYYCGGLVGTSVFGGDLTIENCYSTGDVAGGTYDAGGLISRTWDGTTIKNCFTTGNVSGGYWVGGLVSTTHGTIIENCYSSSNVSGGGALGGLVGENNSSITNCYYNTETSGQDIGIGDDNYNQTVTGLTTEEMQTLSSFENWDFAGLSSDGTEDFWSIATGINNGFPVLLWQLDLSDPELGSAYAEMEGSTTTVACNFTSLGVPNPVAYGFCYSNSEVNPGVLTSDTTCLGVINGYETGDGFSAELSGLDASKTYYVRAFAFNAADTVYSSNVVTLYDPATEIKAREGSFNVYPNPVSSILYVSGSKGVVKLYNVFGDLVLTHDLNQSNAIDISKLESGVYILNVDGEYVKVVKR